jgi:putative addiction module component (TIGR02574 family)
MTSFDISRMSPEQRLALIGELWESLDVDQVEPTTAQKAELDRRLLTLDDEINAGRPAQEIIADLERRFA